MKQKIKRWRLVIIGVVVCMLTGLILNNRTVQIFADVIPLAMSSGAKAEYYTGNRYDNTRRPAEALEHYQKAHQMLPNCAFITQATAMCLVKLGRFEEAGELFRSLDRPFNPYRSGAKAMLASGVMIRGKAQYDRDTQKLAMINGMSDAEARRREAFVVRNGGYFRNGFPMGLSPENLQQYNNMMKQRVQKADEMRTRLRLGQ